MESSEYDEISKEFYAVAEELNRKENFSKLWIIPPTKPNGEFKEFVRSYRILLGVYVELLLKALYMKNGYLIFKTKEPISIFNLKNSVDENRTVELSRLVEKGNLNLILHDMKKDSIEELANGLKIIVSWRNFAAHSHETPEHNDEIHRAAIRAVKILENLSKKTFEPHQI